MDDLARHDGEIFHAGGMLQSELNVQHQIRVLDVFLAVGPGADAVAATGLVGVVAAGVGFAVVILGDVDVVVREFSALEVEARRVGEHLLERWSMDLVADRLAVDGVLNRGVLDFEDAVTVRIDV